MDGSTSDLVTIVSLVTNALQSVALAYIAVRYGVTSRKRGGA